MLTAVLALLVLRHSKMLSPSDKSRQHGTFCAYSSRCLQAFVCLAHPMAWCSGMHPNIFGLKLDMRHSVALRPTVPEATLPIP